MFIYLEILKTKNLFERLEKPSLGNFVFCSKPQNFYNVHEFREYKAQ